MFKKIWLLPLVLFAAWKINTDKNLSSMTVREAVQQLHSKKGLGPSSQTKANPLSETPIRDEPDKAPRVSSRLGAWLVQESLRMESVLNPGEAVLIKAQLRQKAARLTSQEAFELTELVKNPDGNTSQRKLAVYLLTELPEKFQTQLGEVVTTPFDFSALEKLPHHVSQVIADRERSLRLQALQALETSLLENPVLAKKLEDRLSQTHDAFLQRAILASVSSARAGKMFWTEKMAQLTKTTERE